MKKLLSFEALERELKYIDLPYIDIASGVRTRLNSTKRKFIRVSRNIIKTAVILAVILVIGSVGVYNSAYRTKQNKLEAAKIQLANELKEKQAQDKLAREAENQKRIEAAEKEKEQDIDKLFEYVKENENVFIGYTSNPSTYYHLNKGLEINDFAEAKKVINKDIKNFAILPYGYKFAYANIHYNWINPSNDVKNKYIQEAIKNKEKIFKIPMVRDDKVLSIYFSFYKEYPTFRISITKTYIPRESKVTFTSYSDENVKIGDREIGILKTEYGKIVRWVESFNEDTISYDVNIPKDYTIEDIEKVIKEISL